MRPHARPADTRNPRRAARLVSAALRSGRSSADDAFDRLLPEELRSVSDRYWTPVPVIRQAAAWLRETGAKDVVDIGSGAGKFCVAAALLTRCRFVGLEHRASLVDASRELAELFEVHDRVSFICAELSQSTELAAAAYYFFNPFGDYSFESERFAEPGLTFTPETHRRDIAAVRALLSGAADGTILITYNGFGGKVPAHYRQIDVVTRLPGTLRLWKKQSVPDDHRLP
jgi:hypothetical protein